MPITLAPLPYDNDALEPNISKETLDYHYGKHHQGYVDKLNKLINGTPFENLELEEIIERARGEAMTDILNNAQQAWNHTFFWNSLSPNGGQRPNGRIAQMVDNEFGSIDKFKKQFRDAAAGLFGSGWVWLCEQAGSLKIISTRNADSPIGTAMTPLLVLDVWEHAYYLDTRNDRGEYINRYLEKMINWDFAASNLDQDRKKKAA
jgi:Fe-Mn family superoxide dismutase